MVRRIGIIGGTGLGQALTQQSGGEEHDVDTPFGDPSGRIITTEIESVPVAILARHGAGHMLNPSSVPYQANIFALRKMGVRHIIASGACGSLVEEIEPRHLIIPDQVIDKTFKRANSFFCGLAEPRDTLEQGHKQAHFTVAQRSNQKVGRNFTLAFKDVGQLLGFLGRRLGWRIDDFHRR
ncbi:MAG: hypothetical protein H8E94_00520 [Alphaproteobacteria bacterium]|nr:hypothetical protein [Alphaproteobacteria bacterium]